MKLKIGSKVFEVKFNDSETSKKVQAKFPICSQIDNRWGAEVYFYTSFNFPVFSDQEVFEPGDIVYWKSKKSEKEAIAIFFGNTPKDDGKLPRAASACDKIGRILNIEGHEDIKKDDKIQFE